MPNVDMVAMIMSVSRTVQFDSTVVFTAFNSSKRGRPFHIRHRPVFFTLQFQLLSSVSTVDQDYLDADCVDPEKVELHDRRITAERPALDGIDLGAQKISPNNIVPSVTHYFSA